MTATEKEHISILHQDGVGATKIAKELGLSVNTVKAHLRRNPVAEGKPTLEITDGSVCKQCGTPLSQLSHRKTKTFCSDCCRLAWWNNHRSEVSKKSALIMTCEYCGKHFDCYDSENRKYCSRECYFADRFGGEDHDARTV